MHDIHLIICLYLSMHVPDVSLIQAVFSGATENLGQSERHVFTNPVELGMLPSWIAMFLSLVCDLLTTELSLCVTDDPLTAKESCRTLENCLYYSASKQINT